MSLSLRALIFTASLVSQATCYALDNPDAPSYLSDFQVQADRYAKSIESASSGKAAAEERGKYTRFLDGEMSRAFQRVLDKLSPAQKEQLQDSQRAWLKYRDLESNFINANWNQANFGSSSAVSRFAYQSSMTRYRVEQLLQYLNNY